MTRGLRVLPSFTPAAVETSCSGGATSHNKPDCLQGGRAKETFPRFPQFLLHYNPGRVCVAWFKGKKEKKNNHNTEPRRSEINTSWGGEDFFALLNLSHSCSHFWRPNGKNNDNTRREGGRGTRETDTDAETDRRRFLPSYSLLRETPWALFWNPLQS